MECQIAALCDAANLSADGKINILGEFDTLFGEAVPVGHPSIVFVAKIKYGQADVGPHKIELRVIDDDMNLITQLTGEAQVNAGPVPGLETGWPIILQISGAVFPAFGTYLFQLLVDGQRFTNLPLHVRRR